jgi:hypothetical protein
MSTVPISLEHLELLLEIVSSVEDTLYRRDDPLSQSLWELVLIFDKYHAAAIKEAQDGPALEG